MTLLNSGLRTICTMDSNNYGMQDSSTSPIPAPPPMPTNKHSYNQNCTEPFNQPLIMNNTYAAPVWFDEIQNNRMFSKIRIELGGLGQDLIGQDSLNQGQDIQTVEHNLETFTNYQQELFVINVSGSSNI